MPETSTAVDVGSLFFENRAYSRIMRKRFENQLWKYITDQTRFLSNSAAPGPTTKEQVRPHDVSVPARPPPEYQISSESSGLQRSTNMDAKFCTNCGFQIPKQAKFCSSCGQQQQQ